VFRWVRKREDLYTGRFIESYPDIIFEMIEQYGAGGQTAGPEFDQSLSHNIAPGCHKQHHATFLAEGLPNPVTAGVMTLMDFTPTILDVMGISTAGRDLDGKSIMGR
jgi:predicted AlkP superfamily phosphohydrolase/phosphomutase